MKARLKSEPPSPPMDSGQRLNPKFNYLKTEIIYAGKDFTVKCFHSFFTYGIYFLHKIILCKINSGITLVPEAEFRCIMKTVVVHMKSIFMYEKIFCNSGKNTFSQNPPENVPKFSDGNLHCISVIHFVSAEIDRGDQLRFE